MADKNATGVPTAEYRRCWPYHLAMKPLYHLKTEIWSERGMYWLIGAWKIWLRAQLRAARAPALDAVQAIMGFGTEIFEHAEQVGALKVLDCPNTHPTTYHGIWQRECDLWCPGERVPIPRWMFGRMNRELERADLIIVQSTFAKESMELNGIPGERVMTSPMGVDSSVFRKRAAAPVKPRFVNVGTISLRKGHQYLFRAFELVKEKVPQAELICVGGYKHDFRKEKSRWSGTFTHYPFLSHPQLAELLTSCTAFVFPSQEEGIARAQIEALAAGLPVIGTHQGGATTLVEDGVEGMIVNGRDPKQIAVAMVRLASDRQLNLRMGEAAHAKGTVRNSWQHYGDRLLEEYQRRLARLRPAMATPHPSEAAVSVGLDEQQRL